MNQSSSNSSMSRSTAEALKQIQKQGLSISIINPDSSKTVPLETASKDTRAKQNAVATEKVIIPSRSTVSTESKSTVAQSRVSTSSVETRAYNVQPVTSTNQAVQSGNNKSNSQVSGILENKMQNTQRLVNSNTVENKSQSFHNRIGQIDKNQTVIGRAPQNSLSENKMQNSRNAQCLTENKTPVRITQTESKNQIIHPRPQNQSLTSDGKIVSNQSRLSISSPPLEGKTLSNQGRLSQNCSTSVLDKNTSGQRNPLQTSHVKGQNSHSKVTPVRQTDVRTVNASKGQQNIKLTSSPRVISQFHPPASRLSNALNNGKVIVDKSFVTTSDRSINNPFRVASTLSKNSPEEKYLVKLAKVAQNVEVSDDQSIQSKISQHISMKTENKAVSQVIKISEVTSNVHHKSLPFDNSPDLNSQRLNTMPMQRTAVKRIAVASSTPNSSPKKKCIKVISPPVSDQSGSQSDVNTLSSDESPVKEKKIFNLKTLTPGLTITPIHSSTNPSTSGSSKKAVEANQAIFVKCPSCKQASFNLSSCDSCHAKLNANTLYTLTNAQSDSASIVVTQNVTTSIEKSMQIFYQFPGVPNIQLQQSHKVIKVSPKKGRPRRKLVEPVCYTLSSDDEEADPFKSMLEESNSSHLMYPVESEGSKSEHSSNSDALQEGNQDFDDPQYPGVTSINKQQIEGEEEEALDQEMDSESDPMEEEEEEEGEPHDYGEEEEELEEDEEEEEEVDEEIPPDEDEGPMINHKFQLSASASIIITCRSIRIGSIRISPEPNTKSIRVNLSTSGFVFPAFPFTELVDGKAASITIKASETANAWIHFGKCLPIIFAFTSRSFGETVKKTLHMPKSNPPLFDPSSDDVKRNKVTFLIDTLTDEQRSFLRHIFPGPHRLKEIDQKEANEMLVKSTPATLQSIVKLESSSSPQPTVNTCSVSQPIVMIPGNLTSQSISITKVMPKPAPPVPVTKILTYPPPPQTGGIAINTADLATLEEGEFLNDAILDFYLKYVFYEKLSPHDREKTHIFSSFFYPRLTQKPDRLRPGDDPSNTMQVRRHNQVKTWTKHVDIFSKDYIIIPVNQSNHWFLALICYPGNVPDSPIVKIEPEPSKCNDNVTSTDDQEQSRVIIKEETCDGEDAQNPDENSTSSNSFYEVEEPPDSDEASSEIPDSSTHPDGYVTCHEIKGHRRETPCILIFDSLSGPNRWRIASTLREYLEMEWKNRKGSRKVFDRNTMQGFIVKCPQQTNFSDCGLYVLQYVESFFENPIPYFANPMPDLTNWFSDGKISKKRQQLKELILNLQKKYAVKQVGPTTKKVNQSLSSPMTTTQQSDNR